MPLSPPLRPCDEPTIFLRLPDACLFGVGRIRSAEIHTRRRRRLRCDGNRLAGCTLVQVGIALRRRGTETGLASTSVIFREPRRPRPRPRSAGGSFREGCPGAAGMRLARVVHPPAPWLYRLARASTWIPRTPQSDGRRDRSFRPFLRAPLETGALAGTASRRGGSFSSPRVTLVSKGCPLRMTRTETVLPTPAVLASHWRWVPRSMGCPSKPTTTSPAWSLALAAGLESSTYSMTAPRSTLMSSCFLPRRQLAEIADLHRARSA